jgi:hypothetical protein
MKISFLDRIKCSFGAFYFSQEAEDQENNNFWSDMPRNFFKPFIGKVRIYNEWVSRFPFKPISHWKDLRFVGFGFYHHSEDR